MTDFVAESAAESAGMRKSLLVFVYSSSLSPLTNLSGLRRDFYSSEVISSECEALMLDKLSY